MSTLYPIRPATPADFGQLARIEVDSSSAFIPLGFDPNDSADGCTPEDFQRGCDGGALLVAEDSVGQPVGYALVWLLDGAAHLRQLDVLHALQGQGIGRLLVQAAEAAAIARGFHEITLTTFRDVAWNAPWYTRLGYTIFEPGDAYPELRACATHEAEAFPDHPRVAMRKPLL